MKKGRNYQILLILMVLFVSGAYFVAYYLPDHGINTMTYGAECLKCDRPSTISWPTTIYGPTTIYNPTSVSSSTTTTTTSECKYGTISAVYNISFSTYRIFSDVGLTDQYARILVRNAQNELVDSDIVYQGDSASFTSLGFRVRVISVSADSEGNVVGVDVGVGPLTTSCLITSANDWAFRKPVNISNSGPALSNYQTLLTIDTSSLISDGKMRSDCGDMRFISNGANLTYWIESGCNSDSTEVWVKVPSILSGDNQIYMYYGNPYAASSSNATNTFILFDDFTGTSINTTRWKTYVANGGTVSERDELVHSGDTNSWGANAYTNIPLNLNNATITFTARHPSHYTGSPSSALYLIDKSSVLWNTTSYASPLNNKVLLIGSFNGDKAFDSCTIRVIIFAVNITHVTYNSTVTSGSCTNGNITQKTVPFTGVIGSGSLSVNFGTGEYGNNPTYWDNVTIRRFASVEPTISIGDEESILGTTTTTTSGTTTGTTSGTTTGTTSGTTTGTTSGTTTGTTSGTTSTVPAGCVQNSPTIFVSPDSVNAKLGHTYNFTANVTNLDSIQCWNTTFVFNGSSESYILSGITVNLFNFTADPDSFVLPPGQSQTANFSYGSFVAPASSYKLNVTASDVANKNHSGTSSLTFNVSESLLSLSFKCSVTSNGYRCDFGFVTNYLDDATVLFLVSNSKGKVVSSGGSTAVSGGELVFNFYCSTFGSGDYTISWLAFKGSDTNLANPIDGSTTSEDIVLKCG